MDLARTSEALVCPQCDQAVAIPAGAWNDEGLRRCLACPSTDLFVRKDFPQRVGVGIVAAGILASCVTWAMTLPVATFGILFATALVDVVLYLVVPDALTCYRCGATYRLAEGTGGHAPFNLETHERYRQQAARMAG
jgi:hypothetical protein